jgi:hypothetical protein
MIVRKSAVRVFAFVMRDLIDSVLAGVSTGLAKLTGRVRQATIAADMPVFSYFYDEHQVAE